MALAVNHGGTTTTITVGVRLTLPRVLDVAATPGARPTLSGKGVRR